MNRQVKVTNDNAKGRANDTDRLVSKRLKARRVMLGLSQHKLADVLDVSIQQIQKYENSRNRITGGKLYTAAKLLKVPVSYFFEDSSTDNILDNVKDSRNDTQRSNCASEKEIINLVKAFTAIKSHDVRSRFIELARSMG